MSEVRKHPFILLLILLIASTLIDLVTKITDETSIISILS